MCDSGSVKVVLYRMVRELTDATYPQPSRMIQVVQLPDGQSDVVAGHLRQSQIRAPMSCLMGTVGALYSTLPSDTQI